MRVKGNGPPVLVSILASVLWMSACSTSPEVKLASTNILATTEELGNAVTAFQDLYLTEIDKTRTEIEKAFVARAVRNSITTLSEGFDKPEWSDQFRERGLIAVSQAVERAEENSRSLVRNVRDRVPRQGETTEEILSAVGDRQLEKLKVSARALRETGSTEAAAKLEAAIEAKLAERKKNAAVVSSDPIMQGYLQALLELAALRKAIPANLADLDAIVNFLHDTHGFVHSALVTDVKLSGKDLGDFVASHAQQLHLAPTAGGGVQ